MRGIVCALLFFETTINYFDRQILSLTKRILDQTLGWTNKLFGYVDAAFQAACAVGLLLVGRVCLGLREGGDFPSPIHAIALWHPKRERAFALFTICAFANLVAFGLHHLLPLRFRPVSHLAA